MGYKFRAGGREIEVSEARVGQVLALRAFLSRQPRPPASPLNVDGLLDALTRGATEVLPESWATQLNPGVVETHLREIRRSGRTIVERYLKDVREEERYWPPDPQHPMGIHLLLHAEGGPEELIHQMLKTHDPGIQKPEAVALLQEIPEVDFENACAEFFGHNRRHAELEALLRQAESAEEGGDPEKAEGKAEGPRRGRKAGRSITTNSTPSS